MRNHRSSALIASVSAVLLAASSMAQPHEVGEPVTSATGTNSTSQPERDQPTTSYGVPGSTATPASSTDSTTRSDTSTTRSDTNRSTTATSAERDQTMRTSGASSQRGGDAAWILIPVSMQSQSDQMTKGCWVRLYSGDDFEGRFVTIAGPADIPELQSPYGTGMNNWESAEVGPSATVTTFDDDGFRARNATLRSGMRYPDLDDSKLGLFDDIESLRVRCGAQGNSSERTGGSGG